MTTTSASSLVTVVSHVCGALPGAQPRTAQSRFVGPAIAGGAFFMCRGLSSALPGGPADGLSELVHEFGADLGLDARPLGRRVVMDLDVEGLQEPRNRSVDSTFRSTVVTGRCWSRLTSSAGAFGQRPGGLAVGVSVRPPPLRDRGCAVRYGVRTGHRDSWIAQGCGSGSIRPVISSIRRLMASSSRWCRAMTCFSAAGRLAATSFIRSEPST